MPSKESKRINATEEQAAYPMKNEKQYDIRRLHMRIKLNEQL
jgi:hypothetical protein